MAYSELIFMLSIGKASLAKTKTVFIVCSYGENQTWTQQCDQGIREALPGDVLIERFYMDTKRIPEDQFEERAKAAYYFNRRQLRRFGLVLPEAIGRKAIFRQ